MIHPGNKAYPIQKTPRRQQTCKISDRMVKRNVWSWSEKPLGLRILKRLPKWLSAGGQRCMRRFPAQKAVPGYTFQSQHLAKTISSTSLLFLFLLSCSATQAETVVEESQGRNVFSYREKVFTFEDITDVTYKNVKNTINESKHVYSRCAMQALNYLGPLTDFHFPNDPEQGLTKYVTECCNVCIRLFVLDRISKMIEKSYPDVKLTFIHDKEFPMYEKMFARALFESNLSYLNSIQRGLSADEYANDIGLKCTDAFKKRYENRCKSIATYRVELASFPPLVRDHVVPWLHWKMNGYCLFYMVIAIIRRDKDQFMPLWKSYKKRKDMKYNYSWRSLIIENVPEGTQGDIIVGNIIRMVVDRQGRCALKGIAKLNNVFRQFHIPLYIRFINGWPWSGYRKISGMDIIKIPIRKVFYFPPGTSGTMMKSIEPRHRICIYVLGRQSLWPAPTRNNGSKEMVLFGLPRFLIEYIRPKVIKPFAEQVLSDISCFPPYRKPTVNEILKWAGIGPFPKRLSSVVLPDIAEDPMNWCEMK